MLSQREEIIKQLRRMHTGNLVNQAFQALTQICLDQVMLTNFRFILRDTQIDNLTHKMASTFLNRYLKQRFTDFDQVFVTTIVMEIIMDQNISYKYKVLLEETIIQMLEWIQKENLNEIILFIQYGFQMLQKASEKQISTLQIKPLKVGKQLDPTQLNLRNSIEIQFLNEQTYLNFAYSIIHLVQCFSSTKNVDSDDLHRVVRISLKRSLSIFTVQKDQMQIRLQMVVLHVWIRFLEYFQDEKQNHTQFQAITHQIFNEQYFWRKIIEIYNYSAFYLQSQQRILVCSDKQLCKRLINVTKSYACQLHLKLLKHQQRQGITNTYMNLTISSQLFTILLKTLSYLCLHPSFTYKSQSSQFLHSLIQLLMFLCIRHPIIIQQNWNHLVHLAVFPLLELSQDEKQRFENEPDWFIGLAEDTVDKQHFGELKTQAAKYLELLCDHDVKITQYVIHFCLLSIQNRLSTIQGILLTQANLKNINYLNLQTALTILTISSYNLHKFPDQLQIIKSILINDNLTNLSNIQAARVFLFLAYNYEELFKDPLQGKMWVQYALRGKMHQTTKIAALDFLLNVVDMYFSQSFLLQFSQKLLTQDNVLPIFQTVSKMLSLHISLICQSTMCILISTILTLISQQITLYINKQITSTININNGLLILRKVLANHTYVKDKNQVLLRIWMAVEQYQMFRKVGMEQMLIKMLSQFLHLQSYLKPLQSQSIPQHYWLMLPHLLDQFRVQQYRSSPFFWIFNQFIFKGHTHTNQINSIQQILVSGLNYLCKQQKEKRKRGQNNLAIGNNLLVMQHLLMIHSSSLSNQEMLSIYSIAKALIPSAIDSPQHFSSPPTIIGRALLIMVICQMICKERQTDQGNHNQQSNHQFDVLKDLISFHDQPGVFYAHNAKVLVQCLCKQLFTEKDIVNLTQILSIIINVLKPDKISIKQKNRNKSKSNSLKIKIRTVQNYEAILKKIKSPFDSIISETQQLKKALSQMKSSNQVLYKSIINFLPTPIKQKLRQILSTQSNLSQNPKIRIIMKIGGIKQKISLQQTQIKTLNPKRSISLIQPQIQDQILKQSSDEDQIQKEPEESQVEVLKSKAKHNKRLKKLRKNQQGQYYFDE